MNVESLQHLQDSLARVERLVRRAVARARAAGHDPTDALRGLVISDAEVSAHLARPPLSGLWDAAADAAQDIPPMAQPSFRQEATEGTELPLPRLVRAFGLSEVDRDILLICLAPELDRRYERLFAYLQNDVAQRRPTVNLVMNLLADDVAMRFNAWERLAPEAPLRAHHLLSCLPDPSQREPVFLAHQLKLDQRVVAYLLGDSAPDARLGGAARLDDGPVGGEARVPAETLAPIRAALSAAADAPLIYLHGPEGAGRRETAAALCAEVGLRLVSVHLARLRALSLPFELAWRLAVREGRLARAALLLHGWEHCLSEDELPPADLWEALLAYARPVFICGERPWEPRDTARARRLLRVELGVPPYAERLRCWERLLEAQAGRCPQERLAELAGKFRLTPGRIASAMHTAADLAASRGEAISAADLYAGARAHSSARLGKLAQKIRPRFGWDDLILPADRLDQLHEVCARARFAHVVHDEWGFGRKVAPSKGINALFAGESGTGKTMAAEVIANDLGLELYKIDLSAVVSKYIGETEKNLSAIFAEATASNAILFFDEADALFGKRSEVKDAHDRFANIEIAYLLQQMESYDGIAVLATNLRQNLDEAFTRRLDFVVDFPFPGVEDRRRIWEVNFPPQAPLTPEVNLETLAARYPLAGGNIRNAALASAYLAAADGRAITMAHLLHAIRREHQKMGRLLDDELDAELEAMGRELRPVAKS